MYKKQGGENKNDPERCERIKHSGQRINTTAMQNKRRADLKGWQLISPEKANGARDPILDRMLIFQHSQRPKIQRLWNTPFASHSSVGVVLMF